MIKLNYKSYQISRYYIVIILYKVIIDLAYFFNIAPKYHYNGMILNPSLVKYIISSLVFCLSLNYIIKLHKRDKISSLILIVLYYLYFIPGCTLYSFANLSNSYFLFFSFYWFFLFVFFFKFPNFYIPRIGERLSLFLLYGFFFVVVIGSLLIVGYYNDFRINLSLSNVYELRFEQRSMNLPLFVKYFQPIASTLLPLFTIYFFIKKNRLFVYLILLTDLFLFSFGGAKGTIFTLLIAILAYFFYRYERIKLIGIGLLSLNFFSFIENIIYSKSFVAIYIQNRVLFIPNLLSFQFYDFFSRNELLFLRSSFLSKFGFVSPYTQSIPHMIGELYYSDVNNSANNGLIGDAFSNFGWFGCIIYPFIVIAFIKIIDACFFYGNSKIAIVASVIVAMGLINGSFFGLLLTNGFLFICLFLYLIPHNESSVIN